MSQRKFTNSERFAIWKHHHAVCYWCGEPLRLLETTIDHFIPERVENKPEELEELRKRYGLASNFAINDYSNWLPCHDRCNKGKGVRIPPPTFQTMALLEKLAREADQVRKIEIGIKTNLKKDKLLAKIITALETNSITKNDVLELLSQLPQDEDAEILKHEVYLHIDPERWKVVHVSDNQELATVSDGHRGGITPVSENPDLSWSCPICFSYGPWNGIICQNCGFPSDPSV